MNRVSQTYQHTILHVGCFGVDIPYLNALVRRSKNDILADVHRRQYKNTKRKVITNITLAHWGIIHMNHLKLITLRVRQ